MSEMRKYHISQQQDKIPAITSHQEDTPVLTFRYPPACYFYYFAPLQNKLSLNILKHALKDIITYFLEEKEQIYLSIFKPFVFKKIEIFIFHRCSWKDFQDLLTHTHTRRRLILLMCRWGWQGCGTCWVVGRSWSWPTAVGRPGQWTWLLGWSMPMLQALRQRVSVENMSWWCKFH